MQLVIDIDEDTYKDIKKGKVYSSIRDVPQESVLAIANGTPLPKGHGRLKDIDKIEWYGCTTAFDCPHKDRECKDCDRAECSKTQVDDIPTIIEADKAESKES
jgi:hypothetical protein